MPDLRSSKQQLRDELDAMYKSITDPDERERRWLKDRREKLAEDKVSDYGLS